MTTKFSFLAKDPIDPVYGTQEIFQKDPRNTKINLSIGICKEPSGRPWGFSSVDQAEKILAEEKKNRAYLPIIGEAPFGNTVEKIVFGDRICHEKSGLFQTVQTIGGTGAIYIAAHFIARSITKEVYLGDPTWVNHKALFANAGCSVHVYPYYDAKNNSIAFKEMLHSIKTMPEGSVIVLQSACHNPTGMDLSLEEWQELSHLIKEKGIIPLFDNAYQGLGKGLDEDVASIRLFLEDGHDMFVATTFSKNFGLYNERVGGLTVVTAPNHLQAAISQIQTIIRRTYSSPPAHGARLIQKVVHTPQLVDAWKKELAQLRTHLGSIREGLYQHLKTIQDASFEYILETTGLFALLPLASKSVEELQHRDALYVSDNGRINIAAAIDSETQAAIVKRIAPYILKES